MTVLLTPVEARVLGALIEKEITTPEYYPLSLNALVNAANQKNNRDPVTSFDEDEIRQALHGLEDKKLAAPKRGSESRVAKYEHCIQEVFNFSRGETGLICVLLLRGPQTPGELRGRSERLYPFADLDEVNSVLQRLIDRDPPLVKALPRQAGTKEIRYAHLLCGEPDYGAERTGVDPPFAWDKSRENERLSRLESEVAALRQEILGLKDQMAKFL